MDGYRLRVADRLRMVRKVCGMSQEALAEKSSVTRNTITNAERGKHISMVTFFKISQALNVAPHYLILPDEEFLAWWRVLPFVRKGEGDVGVGG